MAYKKGGSITHENYENGVLFCSSPMEFSQNYHGCEGIIGWGEPVVESRAQTVAKAVEEFSRVLIGRPSSYQYLYQIMYRTTFYKGALY